MSKKIKKEEIVINPTPLTWAVPLGIIIILALFLIFLPKKNPFKVTNITPTPVKVNTKALPKDWTVSENAVTGNVKVKLEKKVQSGRTPTVVLITSTSSVNDNKKYIDSLIAGAYSALPSLVINKNEEKNVNGYYMRDITGYYYSGAEKVNIRQQIYKKDDKVFTLTASYDDLNMITDDELTQVFNSLYSSYL